jgi:hypothetical protein
MAGKLEAGRKKILGKIKFGILYLTVQIKILLLGASFLRRRNLKDILPLLFGFLLFSSSNLLFAQTPQWPLVFKGENIQITDNLQDDFSPAIASGMRFQQPFYFIVWSKKTTSGFDIYGARITRDGMRFDEDRGDIPICTAPNDQMFPSVTWDTQNFFVVWQDQRSGKRWDIYGARVTPEGQVLDPKGIRIAEGKSTYDQVGPTLAFDGENHLVAWQGKRNLKTWNIYFARVSKDGKILDEDRIPLNPSLKDQASPAVEFNGENYFVVWQDKRGGKFWDIYGARVTPVGEIIDPEGLPITYSGNSGPDRWSPILSWNGTYHLVVWTISPEKNQWSLYGKRVGKDGAILDVADLHIQKDQSSKAFPAILWDGVEHLLVWEEEPEGNSKIMGASILPDYKALPISDGVLISTSEGKDVSLPALSNAGGNILMVWQGKDPNGYWQIYGQALSKFKE